MPRTLVPITANTRASIVTNTSPMYANALGTNGHNSIAYLDKQAAIFNNNEYAAIIDPTGKVIVARRSFPGGTWSTVDTGLTTDYTDSHNDAVIGIDPLGYIHLAWNMHASALNYKKSTNPEDITSFTTATMTGLHENGVSYPRFFLANNTLFFTYRNGDSYSSDHYLNRYNHVSSTWTALRHPIISGNGASGYFSVYCDNFVADNSGKIHVSFMWRTQNTTPIQLSNYSYAFSTDNGTTWQTNAGYSYSFPNSTQITYATAEIFDSGYVPGLINQQKIDVDGNGHPHIGYWKLGTEGHANYHHAWYNGTTWTISQITSYTDTPTSIVTFVEQSMGRTGLTVNRTTNRVYVYGRPHKNDYMYVYYADAPYTTWHTRDLGGLPGGIMEFGGIDEDYWHTSSTIKLAYTPQYNQNPGTMSMLTADPEVYAYFPRNIATNRRVIGSFTNSLLLKSTASVSLGLQTFLDGTPFTVYGWVNGSNTAAVTSLFSYGYSFSPSSGYSLYTSPTSWIAETGSSFPSLSGVPVPTPNQWHWQAWVFDGTGTMSVYLDNIFAGSFAVAPKTSNAAVNTYVGSGDKNATALYSKVGIHNVALTAAELTTIYQGNAVTRGQLRFFALNEGSGSVATDSSANGINATITGGVWSTSVPTKARTIATNRNVVT